MSQRHEQKKGVTTVARLRGDFQVCESRLRNITSCLVREMLHYIFDNVREHVLGVAGSRAGFAFRTCEMNVQGLLVRVPCSA